MAVEIGYADPTVTRLKKPYPLHEHTPGEEDKEGIGVSVFSKTLIS